MILNSLSVTNFKNIESCSLQFSPKLNCLLGNNGMGKSNLLDAIYFLSFCRSFSGCTDAQLVMRGSDFAMLHGSYTRRDVAEDLAAALRPGHRKSLKRGGKEYQRLSQHIGLFPLVLVSPADSDLANGSGEERRRLMDHAISQADPIYLDALNRYAKALEQRNAMLRQGVADPLLYMAVEAAMEASARTIANARSAWVMAMQPLFEKYYALICDGAEQPQITYSSHLADPAARLADLFEQRRSRDAALGYTSAGPHRDDIEMQLCGMPLRRMASQGQTKTYTIALRLAQYHLLAQATGLRPMLLLDDIFDKLDAERVERIIGIVRSPDFGQTFITDTSRNHLDALLSGPDCALFSVARGAFSPQ